MKKPYALLRRQYSRQGREKVIVGRVGRGWGVMVSGPFNQYQMLTLIEDRRANGHGAPDEHIVRLPRRCWMDPYGFIDRFDPERERRFDANGRMIYGDQLWASTRAAAVREMRAGGGAR